jgi:peptidoglycan/LPS O-acetylase OafA/YrhL
MISYKKKGNDYLTNFFRKRLGKILPLFIALTLGCISYSVLLKQNSLYVVCFQQLLVGGTPLPNTWFIYTIVVFYSAFYVSCKLAKKSRVVSAYSILFVILYSTVLTSLGFSRLWWLTSLSFPIGVYVAENEQMIKSIASSKTLICCSIALGLLIFSLFVCNPAGTVAKCTWSNLLPLIVLLGIYSFGMISNRTLRFLGSISLEIYLVHGLFITKIESGNLSWWCYTILIYAITITFATFCNKITKMFSQKYL